MRDDQIDRWACLWGKFWKLHQWRRLTLNVGGTISPAGPRATCMNEKVSWAVTCMHSCLRTLDCRCDVTGCFNFLLWLLCTGDRHLELWAKSCLLEVVFCQGASSVEWRTCDPCHYSILFPGFQVWATPPRVRSVRFEPRTSYVLGKYSTNWTTSLASVYNLFFWRISFLCSGPSVGSQHLLLLWFI